MADPVGQARHGVTGGIRAAFHCHPVAPLSTVHAVTHLVAGNRGAAAIGRHTPHHRDGLAFGPHGESRRRTRCPARCSRGFGSLAFADAVHCPHLESIQRAVGKIVNGSASRVAGTVGRHPLAPSLAFRSVAVLVTENLRAAVIRRAPVQRHALVTGICGQPRGHTRRRFGQRGAGRGRLTRSDGVRRPHLEFVGLSVLQISNCGAGRCSAARNGRPGTVASAGLLVADLVAEDRRPSVIGRRAPSQGHALVAGFRRQSPGCAGGAFHRNGQSHARTFEARVVAARHRMRQREGLFLVCSGVRRHVHRHSLIGVPVVRREDQRRSDRRPGGRHAVGRAIHLHRHGGQRLRSQTDSVGPTGSRSNGQ